MKSAVQKLGILLAGAVLAVPLSVFGSSHGTTAPASSLEKRVRHELLMLPYLGVFDNLAYKVDGYNVTLVGQVTRPTLKSDAENVVKRIEGVEHVDNQIEYCRRPPWTKAFAVSFTAPSTATRRCRNMD